MSIFRRPSQADLLAAFWSEYALTPRAGTEALPLHPSRERGERLDPTIVKTVEQLHARDDSRLPDPAFLQKLEQDLMATATTMQPALQPLPLPRPPTLNGRTMPNGATWVPALGLRGSRRRWALASLAAALLILLAGIGGYFTLVPPEDRLFGSNDDFAVAIPAAQTETAGSPVQELWRINRDEGIYQAPGNFGIDPDGRIWMLDVTGVIHILSPYGTFIESWGEGGRGEGQFNFVLDCCAWGGIVFDDNGDFYIADTGNYRIQKFDANRNFLLEWGGYGQADGQFLGPTRVTIGPNGNIFVVDSGAPYVKEFDSNGQFIAGHDAVPEPVNIAFDRDGALYSTEECRVLKHDLQGKLLAEWEAIAPEDCAGWLGGLAVDERGNVFVNIVTDPYDAKNSLIRVFDPSGQVLAEWHVRSDSGSTDTFAVAIVLDGHGNLYAHDYWPSTLVKFELLPPLAP